MKVDKMVPKIYYSESRDFSFIGRLFEIVLNYMKTNADLVDNNLDSENISELALQLLNYTLGFESKHDYDNKALIYLASSFSELLREKGTTNSIKKAIQLLLTSQQIDKNAEADILLEHSGDDSYYWECYVPAKLKDVVLLEDLLDYILPAGVLFNIVSNDTKIENPGATEINSAATFEDFNMNDSNLGRVYSSASDTEGVSSNNQDKSISTIGVIVKEIQE